LRKENILSASAGLGSHPRLYMQPGKTLFLAKSRLSKKLFYYETVMGPLISASDMSCSLKHQEHCNVSICTKQSPRKKNHQ